MVSCECMMDFWFWCIYYAKSRRGGEGCKGCEIGIRRVCCRGLVGMGLEGFFWEGFILRYVKVVGFVLVIK